MKLADLEPQIVLAVTPHLPRLTVALVRADVQRESQMPGKIGEVDPLAIGDGGRALGLMQVHYQASQDVGMADDWNKLDVAIIDKDEATAVQLGLKIGCAYLALMLKLFPDPAWALAAYNQGVGVITRAKSYSDAVLALASQAGAGGAIMPGDQRAVVDGPPS